MFLVPSEPNTSRLSIYMFVTLTILETSCFNIALQIRCGPISSPNPFRDLNSICSRHSSQISPRIVLKGLLLFLVQLYNISTNLPTKPHISNITLLLRECVWAKPTSVKIHSQDLELIPVLYNIMEKKVSDGVTLYFHVIPCQPSILLACICHTHFR
jgi:hypothetical protein